jgi:hypothetical protein
MTSKPKPGNRKLTDAARHERFVEMAKEVGASEDRKDFDKAFSVVAGTLPKKSTKRPS